MELGNESLEKERNSETEVREEGRELVEHMSVPSQHLEWSEGGTGTRGTQECSPPSAYGVVLRRDGTRKKKGRCKNIELGAFGVVRRRDRKSWSTGVFPPSAYGVVQRRDGKYFVKISN